MGQKSLTWITQVMILCHGSHLGYQSRIWCLKCFKIATMAATLDIGAKWFSNSESPYHPDASYQVLAQSDLLFGRRCGLKNFKMVPMAAILDIDWLIVLGFNDTSTLEGHFVSSPREREKRDRRDSRGDEKEGQRRKRNRNESEETEEIKTFPLYPYRLQE